MTNSYPDQEQMLPGLLLIQIKAQPGREQRRLGFLPPSKDFSFLLVVGVIFLPRSQTGGERLLDGDADTRSSFQCPSRAWFSLMSQGDFSNVR